MIPNSKEDRIRLSKKKYRDNHKKQRAEYNKQYLMNHPEKKKEYRRRSYLKRGKRGIEYHRKYYKDHREEISEYNRQARIKIKRAAIDLLGGLCVCCGENRLQFLTFDHINNDGKEHRKRGGELWHAGGVHRWVLKNLERAKERLQILCWNCQMAKAHYGICPHKLINYNSLNTNSSIIQGGEIE